MAQGWATVGAGPPAGFRSVGGIPVGRVSLTPGAQSQTPDPVLFPAGSVDGSAPGQRPRARTPPSELARLVVKMRSDVQIGCFSLQKSEIKYTLHLHYEKSIYRNEIKLGT